MRFAGALLMIWIALGVPAFAQQAPAVGLRVGSHPTYGRVVMDWPEAVTYRAEESGNRLVLRFDAPARYDLSGALRMPKNVESISAYDDGILLQARPGTRFRHYRIGNRVVIDVLDGADAGTAAPAARPPPTAPPPREAAPPTSQAATASAPAPSAATCGSSAAAGFTPSASPVATRSAAAAPALLCCSPYA